ncbi:hypothetical protein Ddc_09980 [Ditylenchus destructor]|nr:hypothetical protein Ddc_09980 [Ditylenchus destructor]
MSDSDDSGPIQHFPDVYDESVDGYYEQIEDPVGDVEISIKEIWNMDESTLNTIKSLTHEPVNNNTSPSETAAMLRGNLQATIPGVWFVDASYRQLNLTKIMETKYESAVYYYAGATFYMFVGRLSAENPIPKPPDDQTTIPENSSPSVSDIKFASLML